MLRREPPVVLEHAIAPSVDTSCARGLLMALVGLACAKQVHDHAADDKVPESASTHGHSSVVGRARPPTPLNVFVVERRLRLPRILVGTMNRGHCDETRQTTSSTCA